MAAVAEVAFRGASTHAPAPSPFSLPPGVGRRWRELAGVLLAALALHAAFFSVLSGDGPTSSFIAIAPQRLPVALYVREVAVPAPLAPRARAATGSAPPRAVVAEPGPARFAHPVTAERPAAAPAGLHPGDAVQPLPTAPEVADAVPAGTPADGDLPLYPTRPPPAFAYAYDLQRGAERGSLTLRWRPDGARYEASLSATLADRPWLDLRSSGGFDAAGLAPLRHTDRRRGRGLQATNFQRERGRITFSGSEAERVLAAGVQDRLSWMLQLAAIAAADPALATPGGQISLAVVGVRGEPDRWTFTHAGDETLALADGSRVGTARLVRLPARPYDTRAEVWLDPARHFLPLRVRLSNPPSGHEALQLDWRDMLVPP